MSKIFQNRIKRIIITLLCLFIFSINSIAAIISDNDGSAFVTKSEFEALKKDFNNQIDKYNVSIDNKIDGAIATYLAGINLAKKGTRESLRKGIIWSIGPFDRPRYKRGIPIWDVLTGRIYFPGVGTTSSSNDRSSYVLLKSSWGDDFTNKTPVVNSAWAYRDVLLSNIATNGTSLDGALFDGWYDLCGHWKQIWAVNNLQAAWYDVDPAYLNGVRMVGGVSPQGHSASNEFWTGNFRPAILDASNVNRGQYSNPSLGIFTENGNTNYSSITKGDKLLWDNNVSVFAPISYKCFTEEHENRPSTPNQAGLGASAIRDEINYITLTDTQMAAGTNFTGTNFLYRLLPDRNNYSDNPWNKSSLSNPLSVVQFAMHRYISGSDYNLINQTLPLDITKGFIGSGTYGSTTFYFYQHVYLQDAPFVTSITNWNKAGLNMPSTVDTYLTENSLTSKLLTLEDGKKALSLAAGVPIALVEKEQKIRLKGEFRLGCGYTYNAGTKTNTLNEGTLDTTDAYVVYAKYEPFDTDIYPEDESNLIDISTDENHTSKDTANVGKLAKCRIVRNGKIDIEIDNESNGTEASKDKVIFLKWEKLSNWSTIGSTRKTGAGTNTDVHRLGTKTGETITPPTWTYFGGGYARFDDDFIYEDIG